MPMMSLITLLPVIAGQRRLSLPDLAQLLMGPILLPKEANSELADLSYLQMELLHQGELPWLHTRQNRVLCILRMVL